MNAAAKLGAYGLVLGVALAGSAAIGSVSTAGAHPTAKPAGSSNVTKPSS